MRIVSFSDSHGQHQHLKLPQGDMLIFCGDYTARTSWQELVTDFAPWWNSLDYQYKIFVAGNHDACFQKSKGESRSLLKSTYILNNEMVIIENIRFYGSSVQPVFFDWSFNFPDSKRKEYWSQIPEKTDVLITHCPPDGILDKNYKNESCGDVLLKEAMDKLPNIKYHFFGHIHHSSGIAKINNTTYINSSMLDDRYRLDNINGQSITYGVSNEC